MYPKEYMLRTSFENKRVYGVLLKYSEGIRHIPLHTLHYISVNDEYFDGLKKNYYRKHN